VSASRSRLEEYPIEISDGVAHVEAVAKALTAFGREARVRYLAQFLPFLILIEMLHVILKNMRDAGNPKADIPLCFEQAPHNGLVQMSIIIPRVIGNYRISDLRPLFSELDVKAHGYYCPCRR
jgi:hypothetical protein